MCTQRHHMQHTCRDNSGMPKGLNRAVGPAPDWCLKCRKIWLDVCPVVALDPSLLRACVGPPTRPPARPGRYHDGFRQQTPAPSRHQDGCIEKAPVVANNRWAGEPLLDGSIRMLFIHLRQSCVVGSTTCRTPDQAVLIAGRAATNTRIARERRKMSWSSVRRLCQPYRPRDMQAYTDDRLARKGETID